MDEKLQGRLRVEAADSLQLEELQVKLRSDRADPI